MKSTTNPLAEALYEQGIKHHQSGDLHEAEKSYRAVLTLQSNHYGANHLLGVLAAQAGHLEAAVQLMEKAIKINQSDFSVYNNLGNAFNKLERFSEALNVLDKAIALNPNYAQLYNNKGNTLQGLKRYEEAVNSYTLATDLNPNYTDAYANKCIALSKLQRYSEALNSAQAAFKLDAKSYLANNALGVANYGLKNWVEADTAFLRATELDSGEAEPYYNRGLIFKNNRSYEKAAKLLETACTLKTKNSDYKSQLMQVYILQKQYNKALNQLNDAIDSGVEFENKEYIKSSIKMPACNWSDWEKERLELCEVATKLHTPPFHMLGLIDDPKLHKIVAHCWTKNSIKDSKIKGLIKPCYGSSGEKIKILYCSADFHEHATMHLMAEFFELHDRSKFEIHAFRFGPPVHDVMTARVKPFFESFAEGGNLTDEEIVLEIQSKNYDIVVDLKGYTSDARELIFQTRMAPVQVAYIGYPGTFASPHMDYIIADKWVLPTEEFENYFEKVVRLPRTYQLNDRKRPQPFGVTTRVEHQLNDADFIYCCFNANYKINPPIFAIWMTILRQTEKSVLWLLDDCEDSRVNLIREAENHGIDPKRLVFAHRKSSKDHFARIALADLFLDTLPYNAHTTCSEALWMGVPVLTCPGLSFAARVGASLVNAADLSEFICNSLAQYQEKAIYFCQHRSELEKIRSRLRGKLQTVDLFNTPLLTKDIERAYEMMVERSRDGLPPVSFDVPAE